MKRIIITLVVSLSLSQVALAQIPPASEPEPLSAASAILIEVGSGRVLYEHKADIQRPMASTTKIMTALVAAELCRPEDILKVQADCTKIEGASLYLEEDEQLTLLDMLYGLILRSGNDAAAAIAKYVAGDVGHFVSLMNQRAWMLGMDNTNFGNPHGLDSDGHYSTARDMARVGVEFLSVPLLRQICIADEYVSRELTTGRVRLFKNNNKLLVRDPRACGIKIGWTEEAGRCLVAAAKAGEIGLVAVVLAAPDLYTDVSKLLDFGFQNYKLEELVPQGKVMAVLPVTGGSVSRVAVVSAKSVRYPILPQETLSFSARVQVPIQLAAPVVKGQLVGSALVEVGNNWVAEVELVAVSAVAEREGLWSDFLKLVGGWFYDQ